MATSELERRLMLARLQGQDSGDSGRMAMAQRLMQPQGNATTAGAGIAQAISAALGGLMAGTEMRQGRERRDARDQAMADALKQDQDQRTEAASFFGGGGLAPTAPLPGVTPPAQAAPAAQAGPVQREELSPPGDDNDIAARVLFGEAGGEGPEGMAAAAHVIRNRANLTGQTPDQVVQRPGQFEAWGNPQHRARLMAATPEQTAEARRIMAAVLSGEAPDPTGGATHFLNPALQTQLGRPMPSWATGEGRPIGRHTFFSRPGDFARAPAAPPQGAEFTAAQPPAGPPVAPQHPPAGPQAPDLARILQGMQSPNEHIREAATRQLQVLQAQRQMNQPGPTIPLDGPEGPGVYERGPNGLRRLGGLPEQAPVSAPRHQQDLERQAAGRPSTTVTSERSFNDRLGEQAAKQVDEFRGAAAQGMESVRSSDRILDLLDSGTITGTGAEWRLSANRALASAGLVDGQRVANTEQLMSELARGTLDAAGQLSGPTSDRDIMFLREVANGSIGLTPETIKRAATLMRERGERAVSRYNEAVGPLADDSNASPTVRWMYRRMDAPAPRPGTNRPSLDTFQR